MSKEKNDNKRFRDREALEALEKLKKEYDAFYIENKYGENTNSEEFNLLEQILKDDELSLRALRWIKHEYDCYYEKEQDDNPYSAFNYLKKQINLLKEERKRRKENEKSI